MSDHQYYRMCIAAPVPEVSRSHVYEPGKGRPPFWWKVRMEWVTAELDRHLRSKGGRHDLGTVEIVVAVAIIINTEKTAYYHRFTSWEAILMAVYMREVKKLLWNGDEWVGIN